MPRDLDSTDYHRMSSADVRNAKHRFDIRKGVGVGWVGVIGAYPTRAEAGGSGVTNGNLPRRSDMPESSPCVCGEMPCAVEVQPPVAADSCPAKKALGMTRV